MVLFKILPKKFYQKIHFKIMDTHSGNYPNFEEKSGMPIWTYYVALMPIVVSIVALTINQTTSRLSILLPLTLITLVLWFFLKSLKLSISINKTGISYRFSPFISQKNISWAEIKEAKIVHYDPLYDCGGWGMKHSQKYGNVYNTQGDIGLFVTLQNNRKILIGILDEQKATETLHNIQ